MFIFLKDAEKYLNQEVILRGWIFNFRSSGGIYFLQFRDGTGRIQAIVEKSSVDGQIWERCKKLTLESSVQLKGKIYQEARSPWGLEMKVKDLKIYQIAQEYPIGKKEHGVDFLFSHRHLWIRSEKQNAILKIRDEIVRLLREFMCQYGFVLFDSPILTSASCEETTTLFEIDYFGEKAYLSQSGQLYLEAGAAALNRVYCFGPTFRAEKSKTRRHLIEFWMMEAEAAFVDYQENMEIQEKMIEYVVKKVLEKREKELLILGRDLGKLKRIKIPFPRISYSEAIKILQKKKVKIKFGDDFGGDEETILAQEFNQPVFVYKYPAKIKAFYMKPDPQNPNLVLNDDLLAPEGYGEIIGGSERIDDYELLKKKMQEFNLPQKEYQWYLDLRKYGSFPHSGFGLGLERLIAWVCGLKHIRETIPFPRLINRLRP